ncbi:hypothetical protein P3X46_022098 [Hevea brasiliensis]|uniref:Uncharacterized protein n=1 Tax=Hevea brasiliensis TaxID=3981 RepID=A0ABQ9LHL1_HEVBR|nr:hypothetical protein P3X46_022098 [Hevea brasiliensis]
MFTIPCKIGNTRFERVMLNVVASINVMPRSIYTSLNLVPLKETGVIMQLADRSNAFFDGVIEDVLVQVNELVFPTDFYILNMKNNNSLNIAPILLGRPFLKTSRTKIDVHDGTLSMEFDGEIMHFNIFKTMRYLIDVHSDCSLDVIEPLVQKAFELCGDDKLNVAISYNLNDGEATIAQEEVSLGDELEDMVKELNMLPPQHDRYNVANIVLDISHTKLSPFIEQAPKLELKPLPDHLKYVFLGNGETLLVIIAKNLTSF